MTLTAEPTTALAITSVSYSRLASLGNYENEKVQANARVAEGEDPAAVLQSLKQWVDERVANEARDRGLERDLYDLQGRLQDYEHRVREAKSKWEACERFLAAHGVDVAPWGSELPF